MFDGKQEEKHTYCPLLWLVAGGQAVWAKLDKLKDRAPIQQ